MTPVTPADIEAEIVFEVYQNSGNDIDDWTVSVTKAGLGHLEFKKLEQALSLLTICVIVTKNGHTVTGESYCQDPAKFDAQIGREEARKDAVNKLWPMVVYAARGCA